MRSSTLVVLIGAAVTVPIAVADTNVAVVNPGFEDITGENPFNEFTFGPFNGWDLYDPNAITDGGDGPTFYIGTLTPFEMDPIGNPGVYEYFPDGAIEGNRVAIAFNFAGSHGQGEYGLEQTLTETLTSNTMYTLTVEIGNIATGIAMSGQEFILDGFPGYRVEMRAGEFLLSVDDNSLAGSIPDGAWATSTVTFTPGPTHPALGEPLMIRLVNLNLIDPLFPGSDLEVDFDDVRLTAKPVLNDCAADIVPNGAVDFDDLALLLGCWAPGGPVVPGCASADLIPEGGDLSVDFDDLAALLGTWGACL